MKSRTLSFLFIISSFLSLGYVREYNCMLGIGRKCYLAFILRIKQNTIPPCDDLIDSIVQYMRKKLLYIMSNLTVITIDMIGGSNTMMIIE